jgi:hypothetical protein
MRSQRRASCSSVYIVVPSLYFVGAGAVAGRARTLRDDGAVAQRPGAGTRVLGVHGLTGRCECARCVTWGSNLPDGDPRILGGRDPESRILFLVGLIFLSIFLFRRPP